MSVTRPAARPTNAQVATAALTRVKANGAFGKPVKLTTAQLNAFGTKLSTMAKTNPQQASKLLQRTIDLYGQRSIQIKSNSPLSFGGRNDMAAMVSRVIKAIHKADPAVATPPEMMLAR
jgi:hypothetical protein